MMKKIRFFIISIAMMFLLSGCTDSYEHLLSEEAAVQAVEDIAKGTTVAGSINIRDWCYNAAIGLSNMSKVVSIWVIPCSIIIGVFLLLVFKNTASIKKTAIFLFIIGIPLIMVLLNYGAAFLATWFLV